MINLKPLSMGGSTTINGDGYTISDQKRVKFSVVMEGQTVVRTSTMTSKYTEPGEDFTITLSSDLNTYKDVSMLPDSPAASPYREGGRPEGRPLFAVRVNDTIKSNNLRK